MGRRTKERQSLQTPQPEYATREHEPHWIRRTALLRRLTGPDSPTIAYIGAAAGYGKTALLQQVREKMAAEGSRTVWLDLTEAHRTPSTLVNDLLTAFHSAGIREFESATLMVWASDFEHVAPSPFESLSGHTILLLDDYHRARSRATDRLVDRLLQDTHANLQILIAGRGLPGFRTQRLHESGRLAMIRNEDMLFTSDEVRTLVPEVITNVDLARFLARATGWPLAVSACRFYVSREIPSFTAADAEKLSRALYGYFAEEVFSELREEQKELVERLSVVDTFSVPLADHLLSRRDAGRLVNEFVEEGIFIIRFDDDADTYRFNDLFLGFVRHRLRTLSTTRIDELIKSASGWYLAQGNWREALKLAMTAIEPAAKFEVFEQAGGWILAARFGFNQFNRLLQDAPQDVCAYPRVTVARACLLAQSGMTQEARNLLRRVGETPPKGVTGTTWKAEIQINDVMLHIWEDCPLSSQDLEQIERAMSLNPGEEGELYALAARVLCEGYYHIGYYEKSLALGLRGLALCDHYGAPYAKAYIYIITGLGDYRLGHLAKAKHTFLALQRHVSEWFGDRGSLSDVAAILLACTLYDSGEIDEAERLLDRPLDGILDQEGWMEIGAFGFGVAAWIAAERCDVDKAVTILSEGGRAAARRGFKRLGQISQCLTVFILSSAGRIDEAADIIHDKQFPNEQDCVTGLVGRDHIRLALLMAQASYHLAKREYNEALREVDSYLMDIESARNVPADGFIVGLKFAALVGCGASSEEIEPVIRDFSTYVEKKGYVSSLIGVAGFLREVLERYSDATELSPEIRQIAAKLSERLHPSTPAESGVEVNLSRREQQILESLAEGFANKEIAQRLSLSEGTVRSYRKNLYQKLGVSRRSQAVAFGKSLLPKPHHSN